MEIEVQNKKLRKLAENERKCRKELGERRATLFLQRIDDLVNANTLEDVRYLPGNYHELSANRKGQWACDLDQPYRLIFQPLENPIPTDDNGGYIWVALSVWKSWRLPITTANKFHEY